MLTVDEQNAIVSKKAVLSDPLTCYVVSHGDAS